MNVKVDTVDVPDGNGQTMRKKILVVTKDCKPGEVIFKVCTILLRRHEKFTPQFVRRNSQSSPYSTSTSRKKVHTAHTASVISKPAWPSHHLLIDSTLPIVPRTVKSSQKCSPRTFSSLLNCLSRRRWP